MSRYDELHAEIQRLQTELAEVRAIESREAADTCKTLIAKFGLSPFDLGFVKTQIVPAKKSQPSSFPPKEAKPKPSPKYQNPETGATWSGIGKAPAWINGDRDAYLIRAAAA